MTDQGPGPAPPELLEKIRLLLDQYEAEFVPHEPATPCPLSVTVPMLTGCELYTTRAGVVSVCRDCEGCMEHCECWEDWREPDEEK